MRDLGFVALGFMLGGCCGVFIMCCLQINRLRDKPSGDIQRGSKDDAEWEHMMGR